MGLLDRTETTAGLLAGQPVHMLGRRALNRDTAALRRPGMNLVPNAIKFARENPIEAAVTGVSMSGAEPFATAADVGLAAYDAGRAAWDGRWGDAAMAGGTGAAAIAIPFVGYGGLRSFAGNGAKTAEMAMLSSEEDLEQAETEDVPREMPNGVMDSDAFYRLGQNALNRDTAALRRPGMNLVPNAIGFARENPVEAGLLGASMAVPWPVGDAVGFAGDVMGMVNRPEDRTWGNAALATAGLLPFVPHMALTFAGKGAKTADMAMLRRAEDLEQAGASADDIWRETGWGRGADGEWRFEIDDSGMSLDQSALPRPYNPGVMASTGDLPMDTASAARQNPTMGHNLPDSVENLRASFTTDSEGRDVFRVDGIKTESGNSLGWAHFDPKTGGILSSGQGRFVRPIKEELDAAAKIARLLVPSETSVPQKFFARYGDLPKGGRSKNYATGQLEKGVSAFEMTRDPLRGHSSIVEYDVSPTYLWVKDRPMYEVSGEVIGRGSDGEPLLKGARIVRKIEADEMRPRSVRDRLPK